MEVILIHGMGRSRLCFALLARRLRAAGHQVRYVDYVAALDTLAAARGRLIRRVRARSAGVPYALVGHSLGSVIIRSALSGLADDPPAACCFLAAPIRACRAARFFSRFRVYRLATGEMGTLLADDRFMDRLPMPPRVRVYAGTGGPRRHWLPFGTEVNDGVLLLSEASAAGDAEMREVPNMHTLIMHSRAIADDMLALLAASAPAPWTSPPPGSTLPASEPQRHSPGS